MDSQSWGTRSLEEHDLYHITTDTEGLFHHDCPGLDRGPFRSLAEALAALREYTLTPESSMPGLSRFHSAEAYGQVFPLMGESLLSCSPWSGWKYHMVLKDGFFHVYPPHIGGPFRSLGEAFFAIERHRASLAPPPASEEASLDPQPAVQACLARPPAAEEASHAPPPPAVEASLSPSPAAEASSNPPTYDWRAEEREKGRQLKLYLSQLDPDECLRSVKATLAMWKNHPKKDNKPAEQPVKQSWIGSAREQFKSTTTDPAILEASYRFERLMEEKEAKKNGMKWMQKEALRAYENYKSADKNLEYELVMIHSQCLIYDTFSKSYHHYNFTMRTRQSRSKHWNYQQFFAESKSVEGKTQYFCIPLQPSEHGHCFGCRKVGVSLRHPESGGYEKGNSGSGFPFDTDSESAD